MKEMENSKLKKNKGLLVYAIIVTILLVVAVIYIFWGNDGEGKGEEDNEVKTTKSPTVEQVDKDNSFGTGEDSGNLSDEVTKEPEATKEPEYPIWVKDGERVKYKEKYEIWLSDFRIEKKVDDDGYVLYYVNYKVNIQNVSGEDIKGKYVDVIGDDFIHDSTQLNVYLPYAERNCIRYIPMSDYKNTNENQNDTIYEMKRDVYRSWKAGDIYSCEGTLYMTENEYNEEWDSIKFVMIEYRTEKEILAIKREDINCLKEE